MLATKSFNGVGAERDSELQQGRRLNIRTFLLGSQERREMLLGLSKRLRHYDFAPGDFVSEADGKVVPLSLDLPFAGILDSVGQDNRGRYVGYVITRAVVVLRVEGFSEAANQGALIYASPTSDYRCTFTLEKAGVLVGEVVNREVTLSGNLKVQVGIRTPGDARPYSAAGVADPFETKK